MLENEPVILIFEGGDFQGKTFLANYTKEFLQKEFPNKKIAIVREPGSTESAEDIRGVIKKHSNLEDFTEILLFTAARSELYEKEIKKLVEENAIIIMDRSILSTLVYQENTKDIIELSRRLLYKDYLQYTAKIMMVLNTPKEIIEERMKERELDYLDKRDQDKITKKYKRLIFAIEKMERFPLFNTAAVLNLSGDTEKNKAIVKEYIMEQLERVERGEV